MGIATNIKNTMKKNVFKATKPLRQDVEKFAPVEVVENILAESAQPMANAAKGFLAQHIKSSSMLNAIKIFKGKANYSVTLGVNYDYYNWFVFRFIEYGTIRATSPNKKGGVRVTIDRTPFLRPAFEAYNKDTFSRIQKSVIALITKNLNKDLKK